MKLSRHAQHGWLNKNYVSKQNFAAPKIQKSFFREFDDKPTNY